MADETDAPTPSEQGEEPGWAKALRKKNEATEQRNAELEAKLAERDRADLFSKVGVPETSVGALFRKSYEGELTEDAVRKAALEYEVIKPAQAVPDEERDEHVAFGRELHGDAAQRDYAGSVLQQATAELAAMTDHSPAAIDALLDKYSLGAKTSQ